RSYSLCSSPFENEWKVAVKEVEKGKFSTYTNRELKAGDELDVMTPMGNFQVKTNAENAKSYALFAAGSGITPVLSIIKTILKEEPKSVVSLFYGNKNTGSIVFREEIESLKNMHLDDLRITHILSRESLGNKIQKGRIDEEKCGLLYDAFLAHEGVDEAFLCGPESMIFAAKKALESRGVASENIHFELFTTEGHEPSPEAKKAALHDVKSNVIVILDGDEFPVNLQPGQTILDASYEAGADLPFACKGGVCCTCKAKIIEGSARMDVNFALDEQEVADGFILTCQAHPTSDKIIVSFDE
ncbi:MAG: 2Fe-2S iron-sulfur cluster-binding protein, partial [Emcibacteraceae bacterium]|nr:2Fe-2S iron-sulfur cluster-binding protein [Emcibacteraceae bacterium]